MSTFPLHTIIKQLIDNQSALYITNKTFYNILCDMGCFDDFRKCRYVFKTIVEDGYTSMILDFYQGEKSKEETFLSICNELNSKYRYSVCDISFCLQNIIYGLGIVENVEKYSQNLNYDWIDKLEEVQTVLPTISNALVTEFVVLNNIPSDAKIYVDGRSVINDDESIVLDLSYGQHSLKIISPMFHNYESTIVVDRENPAPIDIKLKPKFGSLLVMADSSETATVYLDNVKVGQAPFSIARLMSGQHTLRLTAPLYHDYIETFTIADGEKLNKVIKMNGDYGNVILDTNDNTMTVFIDGENKGKGKWHGKLSIGKHQVQCFKDAHKNAKFDIYINPGNDKSNHIALPALKCICGCLIVNAKPFGANVYLDGQYIGVSPFKYRNALVGRHKLTIKHIECKPYEKEIFISENSDTTEVASLTKLYGGIKIGDYFYEDGTFSHKFVVGKKPIGLVYSLITSEEEKAKGWTHGRIVSIYEIPENIHYSISRLNTISEEICKISASPNCSNWSIPQISDWNDIFKNLFGFEIGQNIKDKRALLRLNINLDNFPRYAVGCFNIIFYSIKSNCFKSGGDSVTKIRGIAAY